MIEITLYNTFKYIPTLYSYVIYVIQGDSGGPFIYKVGDKWTQFGVTSWGVRCGAGPSVGTRVAGKWVWLPSTNHITIYQITPSNRSSTLQNTTYLELVGDNIFKLCKLTVYFYNYFPI